jgi:hypothetical protein
MPSPLLPRLYRPWTPGAEDYEPKERQEDKGRLLMNRSLRMANRTATTPPTAGVATASDTETASPLPTTGSVISRSMDDVPAAAGAGLSAGTDQLGRRLELLVQVSGMAARIPSNCTTSRSRPCAVARRTPSTITSAARL